MGISKQKALEICHNRLRLLQLEHDTAYSNMILSESESSPGDYTDYNSVILVNECRRKMKAILDQILYLQDLPEHAIIGEEE